ncbi:SDR family NAD(P)-dependent oxidoreductase, partial [Mesorhizobium sp.]
MFALTNKIAIVTGASSGIGRATAKVFAEEGAKVVVA